MKEIKLTQGKMTQVDDQDYEYLTKRFKKFQYVPNHNTCYASTSKVINGKLKYLKLHRLIIERTQDIPPGYEPDHIDRDPLNNQRENLRLVTHSENCMNRNVNNKKQPLCSRCKTRFKYRYYPYCLPCQNEYQRERRKNNPEMTAIETNYKRSYRQRKKEGDVLKRKVI